MRALLRSLVPAALAVALAAVPVRAATIVIVNANASGEGFNDPTPVSPVGGNSGRTLGAQRLQVFQRAAQIWGGLLESPVTIRVHSQFTTLSCSSSEAVLGSAGPITVAYDFPHAPFSRTWYHSALANALAGSDLNPGSTFSDYDIQARFNSVLDNRSSSCIGGDAWYYGLDHDHGTDYDLLAVVLHELGHGLGFSTLVDMASGQEPAASTTDAFARNLLDTSVGKHWNEMTDAERVASSTRTGSVVWDGAHVTAEAATTLAGAPFVRVNSPPAIAGNLTFTLASFSPPPPTSGITADVVLAVDGGAPPNDACSAITNTAAMAGKIALIDRGNCGFTVKALAAQAAGAVAAIIANNTSGPPQGMTGFAPGMTIPVVGISQADGNAIKARLSGGVNMTLGGDPSRMAGADANGRVKLYAPNPVEVGSSISHWDTEALPDLLMEPFITDNLTNDVDLTLPALADVGWTVDPDGNAGGPGDGGDGGTPGPPPLVSMAAGFPNPLTSKSAAPFLFPFTLDRAARVEIFVVDIRGRLVRKLFEGDLGAGGHSGLGDPDLHWDGADDDGMLVRSGIYFLTVRSGKEGDAAPVMVIR